jgi:hypothetical protein
MSAVNKPPLFRWRTNDVRLAGDITGRPFLSSHSMMAADAIIASVL